MLRERMFQQAKTREAVAGAPGQSMVSGCLPRTNAHLWALHSSGPAERTGVTARMRKGCPTVAN